MTKLVVCFFFFLVEDIEFFKKLTTKSLNKYYDIGGLILDYFAAKCKNLFQF